jgi:replicative DNA helicase
MAAMGDVVVMNPPAEDEQPRLPHNIEAEAALLGALMIERSLIDVCADLVAPEHFFEPLHARIFSTIVSQHSQGRIANPVTLKPLFEGDEAMRDVGGPAYLAQLTGSGAVVIGAKDFARQIKDLACLRMLIGGLEQSIAKMRNCEDEVADVISDVEGLIALAGDHEDGDEHMSAGAAAARVVDSLTQERLAGVKSGIGAIDGTMGSLQPADLAILAARPAMGKTATAISYGIGAAKRGEGVLFISIEMKNDHLAERMLSDMCFDDDATRVPFNAITTGHANADQRRHLARAALALEELPIQLVDVSAPTPAKISRLIKRYKRRFEAKGQKLKLVIVDYLQLVRPDHREKDLYTATSSVSQGLKAAAKSNGVALMALCQLSRAVEQRADKRPNLSDLRDSGSIEQDADVVMFLLRPEYYLAQAKPEVEDQLLIWEDAMRKVANVIEFIVPKVRRGSPGSGRGVFYGHCQAVRS